MSSESKTSTAGAPASTQHDSAATAGFATADTAPRDLEGYGSCPAEKCESTYAGQNRLPARPVASAPPGATFLGFEVRTLVMRVGGVLLLLLVLWLTVRSREALEANQHRQQLRAQADASVVDLKPVPLTQRPWSFYHQGFYLGEYVPAARRFLSRREQAALRGEEKAAQGAEVAALLAAWPGANPPTGEQVLRARRELIEKLERKNREAAPEVRASADVIANIADVALLEKAKAARRHENAERWWFL